MSSAMSPNHGTPPHAEVSRPAGIAAPAPADGARPALIGTLGREGPLREVAGSGPGGLPGRVLTPQEFGVRFGESWRILWCAAVSVVRDRTLAQDIVQQAAVVALERLNDFDAQTSFVSWMVRIVKNLALNESRKTSRRKTAATDTSILDAGASGALAPAPVTVSGRGEVYADQAAFDDDVLHALDTLEDTARGCLLLRVVLDLPYREIALALDIPEGTAASHVHRARKLMRDRLRERLRTGPRAALGLSGEPS